MFEYKLKYCSIQSIASYNYDNRWLCIYSLHNMSNNSTVSFYTSNACRLLQ